MLINDDFGFIHIPKTGGQTIEYMMLDIFSKTKRDCLLYKNKNPQLGPPRLAHLTQTEYRKLYNYVPKKFMLLVRNPLDRFLSEIRFRGYNQIQAEIYLNKIQANMVCDDYSSGEDYRRHIQRQTDFFEQTSSSKVIKIKFDSFFANPHRYLEYLGLQYNKTIPHLKPSAHKHNTVENIKLTNAMVRKIEDFYEIDYQCYENETIDIT